VRTGGGSGSFQVRGVGGGGHHAMHRLQMALDVKVLCARISVQDPNAAVFRTDRKDARCAHAFAGCQAATALLREQDPDRLVLGAVGPYAKVGQIAGRRGTAVLLPERGFPLRGVGGTGRWCPQLQAVQGRRLPWQHDQVPHPREQTGTPLPCRRAQARRPSSQRREDELHANHSACSSLCMWQRTFFSPTTPAAPSGAALCINSC
jgi:hypothetical protein